MLSNDKLPYVGRFACGWHRLATTDLDCLHEASYVASWRRVTTFGKTRRCGYRQPDDGNMPRGRHARRGTRHGRPRCDYVVDEQHRTVATRQTAAFCHEHWTNGTGGSISTGLRRTIDPV